MEPPRTISVSQVNAYLGCSLKYRFQYVDKIPRPWRVATMAFGSSVHAAVEWFHKERLDLADPETGEVFDLRLRGIIDLVEEGETLVDLKTAGRTLEQGGLERHLQLSTYALAFFLLHGSIPKLRLDMLLKTAKPRLERHPTTRSIEELGWTARLIHEVAAAIETEHFFPNPSWRCTECEYFAHCQQWRGTWPLPSEQLMTVSDGEGVGESVGA